MYATSTASSSSLTGSLPVRPWNSYKAPLKPERRVTFCLISVAYRAVPSKNLPAAQIQKFFAERQNPGADQDKILPPLSHAGLGVGLRAYNGLNGGLRK